MHRILPILFVFFISCQNNAPEPESPPPAAPITEYDVLIENGTIYDGSGDAPFIGDVGINADTVAAIGQLDAVGKITIDATGKAVAPGFINMLSWANLTLLEDSHSQSNIRQGITLEVMGEGTSMGPLNAEMKEQMAKDQVEFKFEVAWNTLGEYLQHLEKVGVSCNVASFVGNGTVRQNVMGFKKGKPTAEEMAEMKSLVDEAMREGAMGLASALLYAPSSSASTEELTELAKVTAQYDGMYISHIRDEGDEVLGSIEELISIARGAGCPAEIYHLKTAKASNWPKMDSAIAMINEARAEGLTITANMYPYVASSTGLYTQLPQSLRAQGMTAVIAMLHDTVQRAEVLKLVKFKNMPTNIMLSGFSNPALKRHTGKRLSALAIQLGKTPEETLLDILVEDKGRTQAVYFSMSEDNVRKAIVQPWMSFGTDAGSYTTSGVFLTIPVHPRAYGTFPRVLGKYCRDEQLLTLEDAIRRMTSFPAENLKIKKRGRLKPGYFADVVIFDPATVTDRATFERPHQYSEGVEQVFVNGVQVISDCHHTGAKPGRFVPGPGFEK